MAYLFFLNDEMDEAEKAANRNTTRHLRQDLRDTQDPFAIPDAACVGLYRLPKHLVQQLIADLEPHIKYNVQSISFCKHICYGFLKLYTQISIIKIIKIFTHNVICI